jgi:hypothetical protein
MNPAQLGSLERAFLLNGAMSGTAGNTIVMEPTPLFRHAALVYHRAWYTDGWMPGFVCVHRFKSLKGSRRPVHVVLEHVSDGTMGVCCFDATAREGGQDLLRRAWVTFDGQDALDYAKAKAPPPK